MSWAGLIPADGETWKIRAGRGALAAQEVRREHGGYAQQCGVHGSAQLALRRDGAVVEMEVLALAPYHRKAVFNYDFNSLKKDDLVIKAVYTVPARRSTGP